MAKFRQIWSHCFRSKTDLLIRLRTDGQLARVQHPLRLYIKCADPLTIVRICFCFSSLTLSFIWGIVLFLKNGPFPASFSLFSSFQYNWQKNVQYKFLPMTGFEPRTSVIGSDRSTNWGTTTAPTKLVSVLCNNSIESLETDCTETIWQHWPHFGSFLPLGWAILA